MAYVREGDTVVVWKLTGWAATRCTSWRPSRRLTDRGVTLVSTTDGIDSSTAAGRMMIGSWVRSLNTSASWSRSALRSSGRCHVTNGTKFGRPSKGDDPEHIATAKRMKADGHTGRDIAKYLGVSRATLYRYLAEEAV